MYAADRFEWIQMKTTLGGLKCLDNSFIYFCDLKQKCVKIKIKSNLDLILIVFHAYIVVS